MDLYIVLIASHKSMSKLYISLCCVSVGGVVICMPLSFFYGIFLYLYLQHLNSVNRGTHQKCICFS